MATTKSTAPTAPEDIVTLERLRAELLQKLLDVSAMLAGAAAIIASDTFRSTTKTEDQLERIINLANTKIDEIWDQVDIECQEIVVARAPEIA